MSYYAKYQRKFYRYSRPTYELLFYRMLRYCIISIRKKDQKINWLWDTLCYKSPQLLSWNFQILDISFMSYLIIYLLLSYQKYLDLRAIYINDL